MGTEKEVAIYLRLYNRTKAGLGAALGGLQAFRRKANQILKSVGMHARRLALGIAAIGVAAILTGAQFEQSMANVGAITLANTEQMAALENAALEMGRTTAFSASQASEALYSLASAGLAVEDSIAALPAVLALAGATMTDLGETAESLAAAMNSFQLESDQAMRVANTFAASIKESPLTMTRLGDAMAYAGATGAALGMTLEGTVAGVALLHKMGLKGSQAGNLYRSVLLQITEAMNSQEGAIGNALQGWDSATEGLVGALSRMEDAGIDGRKALEELGMRGGPGLAAMLTLGSKELAELEANITGTTQATDAYTRQMNTTKGLFALFTSAAQELGIQIFKALGPNLEAAIQTMTEAVLRFGPAVVNAFGSAGDAVAGFVYWIADASRWVKAHASTLKVFGIVVGVLVLGIYGLATAQMALNVAMNLNVVGIIVIAVIALIAGIAALVQETIGWGRVWFEMKKIGQSAAVVLVAEWGRVRLALSLISDVMIAVSKTIDKSMSIGLDVFKDFVRSVKDLFGGLGDILLGVFTLDKDRIKKGLADAGEALTRSMGDAFAGAGAEFDRIWENVDGEAAAEEGRQITRDMMVAVGKIMGEEWVPPEVPVNIVPGDDGFIGPVWEDPVAADAPDYSKQREAYADLMAGFSESAEDTSNEIAAVMADGFQTAWDSALDIDMTGKARREKVWESIKKSGWDAVGDLVKSWAWGEGAKTAATVAGEETRAAVESKGMLLTVGNHLKRIGMWMKEAAVAMYAAAAAAFKSVAGIPFLGVGLGIAAAAAIFAGLSKYLPGFEKGGPVNATGPANLHDGEFVMPAEQTDQFRPMLEMMRAGMQPAAAGGMNVTVQVAEGSLLVADDDFSVTRFAEKIWTAIERKVRSRYRGD